jgi:hypothetical protein
MGAVTIEAATSERKCAYEGLGRLPAGKSTGWLLLDELRCRFFCTTVVRQQQNVKVHRGQ